MVNWGTGTQQKTVSWPLTIHPSRCTGGCWFTVAEFCPFIVFALLDITPPDIVVVGLWYKAPLKRSQYVLTLCWRASSLRTFFSDRQGSWEDPQVREHTPETYVHMCHLQQVYWLFPTEALCQGTPSERV
jgi:hypothetical protein